MSRFVILATVVLAWVATTASVQGCRGEPPNGGGHRGLHLVFRDQDAESDRSLRFEVDGEGELRVGSGREAERDQVSEIVSLSTKDLDALRAAIGQAGRLEDSSRLPSAGGPRRLDVVLDWNGEARRSTERADGRVFSMGTTAVLDELVEEARSRFGDGLPGGR